MKEENPLKAWWRTHIWTNRSEGAHSLGLTHFCGLASITVAIWATMSTKSDRSWHRGEIVQWQHNSGEGTTHLRQLDLGAALSIAVKEADHCFHSSQLRRTNMQYFLRSCILCTNQLHLCLLRQLWRYRLKGLVKSYDGRTDHWDFT